MPQHAQAIDIGELATVHSEGGREEEEGGWRDGAHRSPVSSCCREMDHGNRAGTATHLYKLNSQSQRSRRLSCDLKPVEEEASKSSCLLTLLHYCMSMMAPL